MAGGQEGGAEGRRRTWRRIALFWALIALAIGLRAYKLGDEAIWYDEYVSYRSLDAPSLGRHLARVREMDPPMMPGYFTVQYAWGRLVGVSALKTRLLSLLLGTAALGVVYLVVRRVWSDSAALLTLALLALSRSLVVYSQEIRMYALALLLAWLSIYFIFRGGYERSRAALALNGLVNLGLILTHVFAALLIAAEFAYLAITALRTGEREARRSLVVWAAAHGAHAAALAVWYARMDHAALKSAADWITEEAGAKLLGMIALTANGMRAGTKDFTYYAGLPRVFLITMGVLTTLLMAWGVYRTLGSAARRRGRAGNGYALFLSCGLIPPFLLFALSEIVRPSFVDRYVLFSVPAVAAMIAGGLLALPKRWMRLAAGGVLAAALCWSLFSLERPIRANWREAAAVLRQNQAKEPVVFAWMVAKPLSMYLGWPMDRLRVAGDEEEFVHLIIQRLREDEVCWAVMGDHPFDRDRRKVERLMRERGIDYAARVVPSRMRVYIYRATVRD